MYNLEGTHNQKLCSKIPDFYILLEEEEVVSLPQHQLQILPFDFVAEWL